LLFTLCSTGAIFLIGIKKKKWSGGGGERGAKAKMGPTGKGLLLGIFLLEAFFIGVCI
jgi:hypothetical protein